MARTDFALEEPVDNAMLAFEDEEVAQPVVAEEEVMEFGEIDLLSDPYAF
jgi:hypothetical protein